MDIYDELKSASASEGWTESTEVRILCEFIETQLVRFSFTWGPRFTDFLETKQKAK